MPIERETTIITDRDDRVVTASKPFGGMIAAIVGAVVLVLLVLWLLSGGLNFSGGGNAGGAVDVNLPDVNVNRPTT